MLTAVRTVMLSGLLLVPSGHDATAVQVSGDSAGLEFLGFRAGARLDELSFRLRSSGSGALRCKRSKADGRVSECRGVLRDSELAPRVDLWVSAIDSLAGVMTLSGQVDSIRLEDWRRNLTGRYGNVPIRVQGAQRMLQWVRRGRMIRLTWRLEGRGKVASVSLVDGHVLDNWGRSRAAPQRPSAAGDTAQRRSRTR
jgi:hypothetical protein